jgi:methyl-accepting chemotaxis protein
MSTVHWPTPHGVSDSAEPAAGRKGWLASLSVRVKVLLAVALTAVTTLGVAAVGLYEMNRLNNDSQTVTDGNVARLIQVAELRQAITQMQVNGILLQYSPPEQAATYGPLFETALKNANERFTAYRAAGLTDRRWVAGVDRFATIWNRVNVLLAEISTLDPKDPATLAKGIEIGRLMDELDTVVTDLTAFERADAERVASESRTGHRHGQLTMIIAVLVGLGLGVAFALRVSMGLVGPLHELQGVVGAMATGDLTRRARVRSQDEIGRMVEGVNRASESIAYALRTLAGSADTLAGNADELRRTSDEINADAIEAAGQVTVAADAANQVSFNVQTVASGSGEMSASIDEIARNTNDGAAVAAEAVQAAQSTTDIMAQLGESSAQIGTVIKVISSIAEQTNLLALNATIEAARAGDAGKGFAVVAGEVKDLAQETARATENISRQVETIQSDTQRAVAAIGKISTIIQRINDYQLTIASAVEEQTATTNEMNRNVSLAADGSSAIAGNIASVAASAERTKRRAGENQRAAAELARLSAELKAVVSTFTLD